MASFLQVVRAGLQLLQPRIVQCSGGTLDCQAVSGVALPTARVRLGLIREGYPFNWADEMHVVFSDSEQRFSVSRQDHLGAPCGEAAFPWARASLLIDT